jgi:hypothetical protein
MAMKGKPEKTFLHFDREKKEMRNLKNGSRVAPADRL